MNWWQKFKIKWAKKILNKPPVWQYIIFKYNEHNIEKAKAMAEN